MKKNRKLLRKIGVIAVALILGIQMTTVAFADDLSQTEEPANAASQQTEESSGQPVVEQTKEPQANDEETKQKKTAPNAEQKAVKKAVSKKNADPDEESAVEIDLSKGDVTITDKTISQGSSDAIIHKNKAITLKGKGGSVKAVEYRGILILDGAELNDSLIVSQGSKVTIELKEGTKNVVKGQKDCAGIQVNQAADVKVSQDTKVYDNAVTIQGEGTLEATGGEGGAGIGGVDNGIHGSKGSYKTVDSNAGTITILSGTVRAEGTGGAAAIGGGNHGDGGTITIGGTAVVTAKGDAAGIGSGLGSHKLGENDTKGPGYNHGGKITIEGDCKVTATGGWLAAGIGGGYCADSGDILITGGTVKAYGHNNQSSASYGYQGGAGIGGGYQGHCNVTIKGGTITAVAEDDNANNAAAGIGSGATPNSTQARIDSKQNRGPEAKYQQSTVKISGGAIIAKAGSKAGAGIGGGYAADKCQIEISGGDITAIGAAASRSEKLGGAGIGSGNGGKKLKEKYSSKTDLDVSIIGGTIRATGGWGASGIGSGSDNTIANEISIADKADIAAFADGTKFAVDTFVRDKDTKEGATSASTFKERVGERVFQGTFVGTDAEDNRAYEGMKVTAYQDTKPNSANKIYFGKEKRAEQLPEGYRSFAMSMEKNSNYVVKAAKGSDENWFSMDNADRMEKQGHKSDYTFHHHTKDQTLSDSYWLYPNDADEENYYMEGSLKVTKKVTEAGKPYDTNNTYYAGIFTDAAHKILAEDAEGKKMIVELPMDGGSETTIEVSGIPFGDFYIAETDEQGTPIDEAGASYQISIDKDQVTIADSVVPEVTITNNYEEYEGYYYEGTLSITKNVFEGKQEHNLEKGVFYAGIFTDKAMKTLLTDDEGAAAVIPLDMEDASSVTVEVQVPVGANGEAVTYYIAEVDSDGTIINKDSKVKFTPQVKNTAVQVSVEKAGSAVINNTYAKGGAPKIDTTSDRSGGTPQTGDDFHPIPLILLTAAGLAAVILLMRRKKTIQKH